MSVKHALSADHSFVELIAHRAHLHPKRLVVAHFLHRYCERKVAAGRRLAMSLWRDRLTPITGSWLSASNTMMRKELEFCANAGSVVDSRLSTTIDHKAKFFEKNRFIEKF